MATDVNKFQFRLVLLGSNGTGKTSILNRFLFKKFEAKYKPTVEDLFSKDFDLGAIEIKVDFLDTSGSMQFPAMRRLSITTGNAFLIVYALDDASSFDVLKMYMAEIQEARPHDFQDVPIVFAGNKCDTPKEQRKISKEQVSNYVYYELPRLRTKVIECSCKDNVNVDSIFKAYLSLAKVKLSSSLLAASGNCSPKTAPPVRGAQQQDAHKDNPERLALGVRKSCDASIVSSMLKVSLSGKSSREQLAPMKEQQQLKLADQQHQDNDTTEIVLRDAMSAGSQQAASHSKGVFGRSGSHSHGAKKLSVDQSCGTKPRSRSLIWRPSRKTSKTSHDDSSECKVS